MARKVALINMKGGVGKSTLATNLAWAMATPSRNKKVLVIDLDPQFNCSQYLLGASRMENIIENGTPTVWDVFEQLTSVPGRPPEALDPSDAVVRVHPRYSTSRAANLGRIDLIPARLELSQTLRNPTGKEHLLKGAVDNLEGDYDLVIIDCAPTDSVLTTAAYLVADYILVPVRPEFLSTIGLPLLEQSLNDFETRYPGNAPSVLGLVFNAISNYSPEETTSRNEVRQVARRSRWPLFNAQVTYSRSFPKSAREGQPIFRTSYVRTTTRQNFDRFAAEFARKVGL